MIREVKKHKKAYLPLLLLADESEAMIDRYLAQGTLYVMAEDGAIQAVCVVADAGDGVLEIKNLAVNPGCQHRGLGKAMIAFVEARYKGRYSRLLVGTGESPLTLPFYKACGFTYAYRIPDFFTDHYPKPIVEAGVVLKDMIYLEKDL